jgi:hypothetical protein
MKEDPQPCDEISAWKAQQEANREARLRQLYTAEELWKRQQEALAALMRLRPDIQRKQQKDSE